MTDWKHAWRAAAWISVIGPALLVSVFEWEPAGAQVEAEGGSQADGQKVPPTLGPARPQKNPNCDCTVFPWAAECDKECGLVTGLVKSVTRNHITISVPVLKLAPGNGAPLASFEDKTFTVRDNKVLKNLEQGKRVAVTFKREDDETVLSSVRKVEANPAGSEN